MNYERPKQLINKIQDFIEVLEKDGTENVLPVEQVLLQGYAKELYHSLGGAEELIQRPVAHPTTAEEKAVEPEPISAPAPPVIESPAENDQVDIEPRAELHREAPTAAEVAEPPSASAKSDTLIESPVEPPVVKKVEIESRSVSREQAQKSIPLDIAALFQQQAPQDLSEKLAESKLTDLHEAMGINQKIFTINELFGGDGDLFSQTVEKLSSCSSLQEAQDYLAHGVAQSQDWTNRSRKKEAKNFIKLVRRLYL